MRGARLRRGFQVADVIRLLEKLRLKGFPACLPPSSNRNASGPASNGADGKSAWHPAPIRPPNAKLAPVDRIVITVLYQRKLAG